MRFQTVLVVEVHPLTVNALEMFLSCLVIRSNSFGEGLFSALYNEFFELGFGPIVD